MCEVYGGFEAEETTGYWRAFSGVSVPTTGMGAEVLLTKMLHWEEEESPFSPSSRISIAQFHYSPWAVSPLHLLYLY